MSDISKHPSEYLDEEYFAALGLFVHQFAMAERIMASLLASLVGLEADKATAVFSGVRAESAKGLINRTLEVDGRDDLAGRLERPFAQLGHITATRNAILHHGVWLTNDKQLAVLKEGHVRDADEERPASKEVLADMVADLGRIIMALASEALADNVPESIRDALRLSDEPWRYKPPAQSPRRKRRGDSAPKREPRL